VHVAEPYVLFDGQLYRLWYSGYDGDEYRIGLATAPPVYSARGVFTSTIVDAGATVSWSALQWTARVPEGTGLELAVRASPDGQAWSEWAVIHQSGVDGDNAASLTVPPARFFQYQVILTTDDPARSPVLEEVHGLAQPPTLTPTATLSPTATPVPTVTPTPSPPPAPTPVPVVAAASGPAGLVIAALIGALIGGLAVTVLLRRR
jgi:hypothetical protein